MSAGINGFRAICVPAWGLTMALFGLASSLASGQILGLESIDAVLPFFDPKSRSIRDPQPGDELPPMRVLLSRSRFWAQDKHLDVVVQLDAEHPQGALRVRLLDSNGQDLSRFDISPLPGPRFIFYPRIPDGLAEGGKGEIELTWLRESRVVAEHREAFRVEQFEEPAARSGRVRLSMPNRPGLAQRGVPVTAGVPFPRGTLTDVSHLRLVDERDREHPLQVMETARWSKYGSIKWILCDFTVDFEGKAREFHLEYGPAVHRLERPAISVSGSDGFPVVEAGRLRFEGGLWFDVASDGNHIKVLDEQGLSGAFVEHEDGRFYRAPVAGRYEVEESGPEKVVLRREGWYVEEGGDRQFCRYVTRYIIHRDSPFVRIFHTWIFTGDGNRDRIRNMGWQFALPEGFVGRGFLTGFGDAGRWTPGDYLLQWDYEHFDVFAGDELTEYAGGRAPGAAMAVDDGVRLFFGTKDFWQNYPSELEFRNGSLWFHNWPRHIRPAGHTFDKKLLLTSPGPALSSAARYKQEKPNSLTLSEWRLNAVQLRFAHEGETLDFRLPDAFAEDPIYECAVLPENHWDKGVPESTNAQGISRTEEMWLYLAGEDADAARVLQGLNDETLRAVVDPAWVARSGAFGDIHHQDRANYPEDERIYELVALAPSNWAERLGAYGMWIYGDVPAWNPRLSSKTPNLYRAYREGHHGWPYPWIPFARSADSRLLKAAQASTRQMIDACYCHYVSEDVARLAGPNRYRRLGRWERSLLPWAARAGTSTRGYTCHSDHFWHAWYLTGYHRGRDIALTWGAQTKVQEVGGGRWFDHRRGPISHDRTRYALAVSYLDMYEATLDPWFLVALHEILKMNRSEYLRGRPSRVDFWRPWGRDFLRFTGSEEFAKLYLTMVNDPTRWHHLRSAGWGGRRGGGHPRIEPYAYTWRLTGGPYHLNRVAGILQMAKARVYDGHEPWYLRGWEVTGAQVQVSMWVPWYLRLFPAGLAVLDEAEERPSPIGYMFQLGTEPANRAEDGQRMHHAPVIALKKRAGEALPIFLGRIWSNSEMNYAVIGPDGGTALSGLWDAKQNKRLDIPATAPAGVYRFKATFKKSDRLGVPLSEPSIPEVIELNRGEQMPHSGRESRFYFMVPKGVDRFVVVFAETARRMSVWDPNGERVWDVNDRDGGTRAEIDVRPEHASRLWCVTVPASWAPRFRMDPRIPPVYAVDPSRWFDPNEAEQQ